MRAPPSRPFSPSRVETFGSVRYRRFNLTSRWPALSAFPAGKSQLARLLPRPRGRSRTISWFTLAGAVGQRAENKVLATWFYQYKDTDRCKKLIAELIKFNQSWADVLEEGARIRDLPHRGGRVVDYLPSRAASGA